jgi:hypothetical protein
MSSPEDPYSSNLPPSPYSGGPDPDPGLPRRPLYPDPNDTYTPPHYNPDDTQPIPVYDPNASGPLFPETKAVPPEKPGRFAAFGHKIIEIAASAAEKPVAKLAGALAVKGAMTESRGEDMQERDPNKPTRSMRTQRKRMLGDVTRASARHDKVKGRAATEAPALFKDPKGVRGGLGRMKARRQVRKQAALTNDDAEAVQLYKAAEAARVVKAPGRGHRRGTKIVLAGDIDPNAVGMDNPFYSEGVTRKSFDEPVGHGEQPLKSSMPKVRKKAAATARARTNYEEAVEDQVDRMEGSPRSQRIEKRNGKRGERRIVIGGALQELGEGLGEIAENLGDVKESRREAGRDVRRARNARRRYENSDEAREAKEEANAQKEAARDAAKAQSDAEKEANRKAKDAAKAAKEAAKKAKKNPSPDGDEDPDFS